MQNATTEILASSKPSRATQAIHLIALVLILLTPLYNIGEIRAFMLDKMRGEQYLETPLALKLLKDAGMILIFVIAFFIQLKAYLQTKKLSKLVWLYIPLAVWVVIEIIYSYTTNENLQEPHNRVFILAGLRWVYPIFMGLVLTGITDKRLIHRIALLCCALFIGSVIFQVYQAFHASTWWGRTPLGLSARVAGFFFMPSTSGFFTALTVFLTWFCFKKLWVKLGILVLAAFSIWLSASATGALLVAVIVLLVSTKGRYLTPKLALIPLIGIIVYFTIGLITNRNDFTAVSGPVRLNHISESFINSGPISNQFGFGSNGAVLLNTTFKLHLDPIVLDSSYAGAFVNLGWIGAVLFYIPLIYCFILALRARRLDGVVFAMVFFLAGLSQPITEEYPMNFFMGIWMGWFVADVLRPRGQLLAGAATYTPEPDQASDKKQSLPQ